MHLRPRRSSLGGGHRLYGRLARRMGAGVGVGPTRLNRGSHDGDAGLAMRWRATARRFVGVAAVVAWVGGALGHRRPAPIGGVEGLCVGLLFAARRWGRCPRPSGRRDCGRCFEKEEVLVCSGGHARAPCSARARQICTIGRAEGSTRRSREMWANIDARAEGIMWGGLASLSPRHEQGSIRCLLTQGSRPGARRTACGGSGSSSPN